MNKLELDFPQDNTEFDPGAEFSVQVGWNLDKPPKSIEVRLVWNTEGKGDRDLKVIKAVQLQSPPQQGNQLVDLRLPWGPYSFSGKLISLTWAVEVVVLPGYDSLRRPIIVAPHGQEVILLKD